MENTIQTRTLTDAVLDLLPGNEVVRAANHAEKEIDRLRAHVVELEEVYDDLWKDYGELAKAATKVETAFVNNEDVRPALDEQRETLQSFIGVVRYPTTSYKKENATL